MLDAAHFSGTRVVGGSRMAINLAIMIAGSVFLAVCSWISVPMVPVPITMQTFGFLVLGGLCGWRLGLATSLTYLVEGAIGFPVFAGGGSGLAHLLGPTGGYLLAFPAAAAAVGLVSERTSRTVWILAAMIAAHGFILIVGSAYLSMHIGIEKAIQFGLAPFLLGSLLKAALATATVQLFSRKSLRW